MLKTGGQKSFAKGVHSSQRASHKSRSLTRMRKPGNSIKTSITNFGSIDSPMCADNDPHYAEYHSDFLKVGIAIEVADSKIVSRSRVVVSTSSIYHSNLLDEPENISHGRQSISSKLGKWRQFFPEKSIFWKSHI